MRASWSARSLMTLPIGWLVNHARHACRAASSIGSMLSLRRMVTVGCHSDTRPPLCVSTGGAVFMPEIRRRRMPGSVPQTANLCKFGLTNANHFALSYLRQPARALTRTRRSVATVAFCPAHEVTIGPWGALFKRASVRSDDCVATSSHCPAFTLVLPAFRRPSERRIRYTLGTVLVYSPNAPAAAPEAFPTTVETSPRLPPQGTHCQ